MRKWTKENAIECLGRAVVEDRKQRHHSAVYELLPDDIVERMPYAKQMFKALSEHCMQEGYAWTWSRFYGTVEGYKKLYAEEFGEQPPDVASSITEEKLDTLMDTFEKSFDRTLKPGTPLNEQPFACPMSHYLVHVEPWLPKGL